MADAQANIGIGIDTTQALAAIRQLQREISVFHTLMAKGGANVAAESLRMRQGLINNINETGKFSARMTQISSSTESFTNSLERNKFSMGQYFKYAGASTKTFGKLFTREFDTINRVATERVKDLQTQYISMGRDANGALQAIKVRPLALDMESLSTRTMMAAQKQQLFNQVLKQGSTNLLNFGKNTQWAGRQLMVGFTIPLAIFGTAAAREFQKLEEQAIKFRRVYGDMFTTTGQTERALENVRELASEFTKYGIAVEKTVGLAARVAQMGNMGDALDAQVRQATRLSVLGGLEQEEALDTTISLTNAFGVSVDELADKVNFLNAAENQTILSIEDFNEAIPKAGSVVKALGGDVEDLAFFLTAMREGGISASQGANALKSSLGRLINPTEEARKRLANLGIDVVGIVEANAGNLRGTVMALAQALDTLDPLQKSRAIEQLFGKFQFARMSTMFNNIVDSGSQANKVLQLTGNSVQELGILADREMSRVEDSVAYKFNKSLEDFKATLAPLGEAFLKAVTPLVEFGTKILNKFNEMGDGAKQFVVVMAAVLGAIGPVALMSFGLLANGVANLIKMFANLGIFYQRITGQSKGLGLSTEYMTQQQIEAAAVASSLNQSHATLIQTFSAEATAVDRLTAAYSRAVAAQRTFQGSAVARGGAGGTKKYAAGVVSVPGPRGAGDVVPAMLSPGEAVIPADMAKRYAPVINQMISGKIPGYEQGLKAEETKATTTRGQRPATPARVAGYTNAVMYLPGRENLRLNSGGADVKDLRSALGYQGANKPMAAGSAAAQAPMVDSIARALGKTSNSKQIAQQIQNNPEFKKFANNVNKGIAQALPKSGKIADPQFQKIATAAIDKELKTGGYSKEFQKAGRGVLTQQTMFQDPTNKRIRSNGKLDLQGRGQVRAGVPGYRRNYTSAITALGGKAQAFVGQHLSHMTGSKQLDLSKVSNLSKEASDAKARLKSGVDRVTYKDTEGNKRSVTVKRGSSVAEVQAKIAKSGGTLVKETDKAAKETKKAAAATKKETAAKTKNAKAVEKATNAVAAKKPGQVVSTVDKNGNVRFYQDGKRITNEKGTAAVKRSEAAQKAAQTRAANKASAPASPAAKPDAAGAAAKSRLGLGGMAAIASVGAMAASFAPGKVGEVAQQLILPLMMLPTILPLLKNPIVLAIAAVAALGVGIFMLHKKLKDATKSGIDAGQALSMTADKLKSISEVTGTVSATELRQQQQQAQLTASGPEFNSFGLGFVQDSEQGKAMLADIEKQFTSGSSVEQVGENMGRQLAMAITQGAVSVDQARSIAVALGTELGDYTLSTNISGKLTELLGVDGNDLTQNPLEVAIRIKEDSIQEQVDIFENALSVISDNSEKVGGWQNLPFVNMFAVPIEFFNRTKENKEVTAAAVQLGVEQLSQNQMLLDSVNQRYDMLVAQATTEEEINRLQAERRTAIQEINEANAETTAQILEQAKAFDDIGLYQDAMAESIRQRYSEGPMKVFSEEALKQLAEVDNQDFAMTLSLQMATGELSPISVLKLIEVGENNESFQVSFETSMKTQGSAQTNQLMTLLTQNNVSNNAFPVMFDFVVNSGGEFDNMLEALGVISSLGTRYGFEFDLSTNGEEQLQEVAEIIGKYQGLPDVITKEAFIETAAGDANLTKLLDNWEDLNLTDNVSRQFVIDFITRTSQADPDLVRAYMADQGIAMTGTRSRSRRGRTVTTNAPSSADMSKYGTAAAVWNLGQTMPVTTDTNDPSGEGEGEGTGAGAAPQLDSLLKKIRDVRQATISMRKGWDGMNQSIKEFLDSGINGFSGLANQMRSIGVGENLIERIVGMDPDEYAERKDELFVFDKNGNIVGVTEKLNNLGLAMNKVAIGEYINSQQAFIENTKNQFTAMQMLTAAGLSFVDAYELVQDQAIATAIAMAATKEEVEEIIDIIERLNRLQEKSDRLSEEKQAAEALKRTNDQFMERARAIRKLASEQGKYSDEQISAIMNDPNLTKLYLNPSISPTELSRALQQAKAAADLELQISVSTEEGKKGLFDSLMGDIQTQFNRQATEIELDFKAATSGDSDIVSQAQQQIAAIQYEIDDYQAQLKGIQDQEEVINDKYNDRYEALEQVAAANERISRIRSAELDIADALSRGDIAAAARAQQQLRATEAENRAQTEREMLEKQQAAEIARLRSASGQSREEIESAIKNKQDEIFTIEEGQLEPAQERIRLAEYQKNLDIEGLEIAGKTRDEWDQIANAVDLASVNMDDFNKKIQQALALFEYFVNGKDLDASLFGADEIQELVDTGVVSGDRVDYGPQKPTPAPTPTPTKSDNGSGGSKTVLEALREAETKDPTVVQANKDIASANKTIEALSGSSMPGNKSIVDAMVKQKADAAYTKSWALKAVATSAGANLTPKSSTPSGGQAAALNKQKSSSSSTSSRTTPIPSKSSAPKPKTDSSDNKFKNLAPKKTTTTKRFITVGGQKIYYNQGGSVPGYSIGGNVKGYSVGGMFTSMGSDNVPAMLSPGEYVVRKRAVQDFGTKNLEAINNGTYSGGSVYNYNLAVNVKSDADPDRIARVVMKQIKRVDSQRVRGNRI